MSCPVLVSKKQFMMEREENREEEIERGRERERFERERERDGRGTDRRVPLAPRERCTHDSWMSPEMS